MHVQPRSQQRAAILAAVAREIRGLGGRRGERAELGVRVAMLDVVPAGGAAEIRARADQPLEPRQPEVVQADHRIVRVDQGTELAGGGGVADEGDTAVELAEQVFRAGRVHSWRGTEWMAERGHEKPTAPASGREGTGRGGRSGRTNNRLRNVRCSRALPEGAIIGATGARFAGAGSPARASRCRIARGCCSGRIAWTPPRR